MIPKQKAEELVDKYYMIGIHKNHVVRCAEIAVEEVIDELTRLQEMYIKKAPDWEFSTKRMKMMLLNAKMLKAITIPNWKLVLQEIEKIKY